MIIAVDFDGTCVTHEYPNVGKDVGAAPVLRALVENGHKLILWTMRSGRFLMDAKDWFDQNKIELWGINCNPEQKSWTESPKAYAQLYLDDAAYGAPLIQDAHPRAYFDWGWAEMQFRKGGIIK
jgi:hydroxymethylpyrimidine pyrophosphatase-like HAD family hydrolase